MSWQGLFFHYSLHNSCRYSMDIRKKCIHNNRGDRLICEICGKPIITNMYIGRLEDDEIKTFHTLCYSKKYGLLNSDNQAYPNKRRRDCEVKSLTYTG